MKKTIFKVKYGYGTSEFVLVDSLDELARAFYAKAEKIGVTLGGKFISGQEIKTIEPDIHSYTGWYRTYEPTDPDDYRQIERDVPKHLFELVEGVAKRVSHHINTGNVHKIGKEGLTVELLLTEKGTSQDRAELQAPTYQLAPKKFN